MSDAAAFEELLRERARLVSQASRRKVDREAVKAPERVLVVIANVRSAALAAGLDANEIEARYRRLIAEYIAWEALCFERASADRGAPRAEPAASLEAIRARIDEVDREIVTSLAAPRSGHVCLEGTRDADVDALVARVSSILRG